MQNGIFTSFTLEGEPQLNTWLEQKGIEYSIGDLYHDRISCPECGPELLEAFKVPYTFNLRVAIANALFARKLNASQKREAVEILLTIINQNPERHASLSTLILNELANNVDVGKVHELGKMLLDERFGELRADFTEPLRKIGNADAISYLKQAAKIPSAAPMALNALARLRVEGAMQLCEEALKDPKMPYKDVIRETYRKLQRKQAKKRVAASHMTSEPVPEGLEEWSANLDGSDLAKVLRGVQKCVEGGLGKAEIAEIRAAAEDLSPDGMSTDEEREVVRLKFDVKFNGGERELWFEVFCDDEDAYDFYIYATSKLIEEIEGALKKVLPE
ncbi:MAG: hypothetical protein JWQ71_3328 [Pedosphaera sp.]|nr:hypothetical protein [Pedosphaera sp.]